VTSTKPTSPAVDAEDTATRVGPMHQAFADFLNSQHGGNGITAEQVFLVTSKRKAFRATDAYRVGVKTAQEQAKAQAAAAREKAKAERAAQRAVAKAENAQTPVAEATTSENAPEPKPTTKRTTKAKTIPAAAPSTTA
jgi:hypothetical protein